CRAERPRSRGGRRLVARFAELLVDHARRPGLGSRGRVEALRRPLQGTWKLEPDRAEMRVTLLNDSVAQLYVPILFTIGGAGAPPQATRFLMNQTLVKTSAGWKVASILPIPAPAT